MGTPTANYGWVKPIVGGDTDSWGVEINSDLDGIDSTVYGIQQSVPTAGSALPIVNGVANAGSSANFSRVDHIHPTDVSRAPLNSPAFSGVPTAPTPAPGDNSTKVATTAFAATSYAPLNSPAFVGTPTAPTPASGDNSTKVSNTAFVQNAIVTQPNFSFRNRIINGDFLYDQRNEGATVSLAAGVPTYGPDRWRATNTVAGKFSVLRSPLTAAGAQATNITDAMQSVVPATPYSPAATDNNSIWQPIEADVVRDLAWSTSGALPVVLSFWASSSVAGIYSAFVGYGGSGGRVYIATFTLAASVWNYVQLPIPGDTGGSWINGGGNGSWGFVGFDMGSGSGLNAPSANSWQTQGANSYRTVASAVRLVNNASAIFNVTKVQFEVGVVATPYELLPPDVQLARCQRYYEKSYPIGTAPGVATGLGAVQGSLAGLVSGNYTPSIPTRYTVRKRAAPATVTLYSTITANKPGFIRDNIANADVASTAANISELGFNVSVAVTAQAGYNQAYHWVADADL